MKTLKRKIADAFIPKGTISKAAYIILAVLSFALIFAVWMYAVYVKGVDGMFHPRKKPWNLRKTCLPEEVISQTSGCPSSVC